MVGVVVIGLVGIPMDPVMCLGVRGLVIVVGRLDIVVREGVNDVGVVETVGDGTLGVGVGVVVRLVSMPSESMSSLACWDSVVNDDRGLGVEVLVENADGSVEVGVDMIALDTLVGVNEGGMDRVLVVMSGLLVARDENSVLLVLQRVRNDLPVGVKDRGLVLRCVGDGVHIQVPLVLNNGAIFVLEVSSVLDECWSLLDLRLLLIQLEMCVNDLRWSSNRMYEPRQQLIRCLLQLPPFPCRANIMPEMVLEPRLVSPCMLRLSMLLMLRFVVVPLMTRLTSWLIRPWLHDGW